MKTPDDQRSLSSVRLFYSQLLLYLLTYVAEWPVRFSEPRIANKAVVSPISGILLGQKMVGIILLWCSKGTSAPHSHTRRWVTRGGWMPEDVVLRQRHKENMQCWFVKKWPEVMLKTQSHAIWILQEATCWIHSYCQGGQKTSNMCTWKRCLLNYWYCLFQRDTQDVKERNGSSSILMFGFRDLDTWGPPYIGLRTNCSQAFDI